MNNDTTPQTRTISLKPRKLSQESKDLRIAQAILAITEMLEADIRGDRSGDHARSVVLGEIALSMQTIVNQIGVIE